jgi:hypothetical protein
VREHMDIVVPRTQPMMSSRTRPGGRERDLTSAQTGDAVCRVGSTGSVLTN